MIENVVNREYIKDKTAIFLSGGIDSAIIASYLPKGTKAYSFKCIADGAIDETEQAKKYAEEYELDYETIEITWDDFQELTPLLMEYDGMPMHSIEILMYKACLYVKSQGIKVIFTGDGADKRYGGLDGLLSKDWTYDEFVKRYTFLDPQQVLKNPVSMNHIFEPYRRDDTGIDFLRFLSEIYGTESFRSYYNAFALAEMKLISPYIETNLTEPLELNRVRNGESKYLIRELFAKRFPEIPVPNKIPMPRATDQWLKDYKPTREEFIPNCEVGLTGDQKWQLFCLEWFLNIYDL